VPDRSKIEWTDATWNPIRGCSRVSEGCKNCYAEKIAARFSGPGQPYEGLAIMKREPGEESAGDPRWTGEVRLIPELLDQPLRWNRPRKIFVNSMSDLFHEKVPNDWIDRIFAVMALCPHHTFQILTKRPERMRKYFDYHSRDVQVSMAVYRIGLPDAEIQEKKLVPLIEDKMGAGPLPHVWLGVSVEGQRTADERVPILSNTPAAVRFVSYEPAIGPVDWCGFHGLHWVICGGESGPGARPMDPAWARNALYRCHQSGVPFFFKQWGEWLHISQMPAAFTPEELERVSFKTVMNNQGDGVMYFRVGKKRAGRALDGVEYSEFPR